MDFGIALGYLKEGKKVKRKIWGGYWFISTMTYMEDQRDWIDTLIVAKLKDGGYAPATAYQEDLLAEDWEVVE